MWEPRAAIWGASMGVAGRRVTWGFDLGGGVDCVMLMREKNVISLLV